MFLFLHICAGIRIQMVNLTSLCWSQPQSRQISSFQCKHTAADNSWLMRCFYTSSYQISHIPCCLSCYYSYYASAILFATHFNKHSDIISVIYSHWSAIDLLCLPLAFHGSTWKENKLTETWDLSIVGMRSRVVFIYTTRGVTTCWP